MIVFYLRVFVPLDYSARSTYTFGLTPVVLRAFFDRLKIVLNIWQKEKMKKRLLVFAALISIIMTASYLSIWAVLASHGIFNPVDFWVYYAEASLIRDGYGNQLYDIGIQSQYQLQLLGVLLQNGSVLPFVGPPHLAIALLPFAMLSPHWAFFFWIALQMILVVLLIILYFAESSEISLPERIIYLGAFVSFPMLFVTIYKGQLSLIILFCIFFWIKAIRKGNDQGIAFWLLIGSIRPQLLVVPFLLTILARKWKALVYFMAGATLITALCIISLGPECIRDFLLSMLRVDSNIFPTPWPIFMYNFKGFLSLILGLGALPLIRSLTIAGFLCALISVIFLWRGRVNVDDEKFDLKMALSVLLGIFFCPYLFGYDTLLLVVVAKLFNDYLMRPVKKNAQWVFIVIIYLIPLSFLKSGFIVIAGYMIRSPVILMIIWMLIMIFIIHGCPNTFYTSRNKKLP